MSIKNQNYFQGKDFQFVINRLPHVQYFGTKFSLPSINMASAIMPTPFSVVKVPGDQMQFTVLTLVFRVDADLRNYEEIFRWMESFGTPHSFGQYKTVTPAPGNKANVRDKVSDIEVILTTNKYNPNVSIIFEDAFPVGISELNIAIDEEGVQAIEASVQFDYTKFTFNRTKIE